MYIDKFHQAGLGTKIVDFGFDETLSEVNDILTAHNEMTEKFITEYAEAVPQDMILSGEPNLFYNLELPLHHYSYKLEWAQHNRYTETLQSVEDDLTKLIASEWQNTRRELQLAVYCPLATTDADVVENNRLITRQPFHNGDEHIPKYYLKNKLIHPHSHYMATQDITQSAISQLVDNVREHGLTGNGCLFINRRQEALIWGMNGSFYPYVTPIPILTPGSSVTMSGLQNHSIGLFDGFEVWVKSWVLPDTMVAMDLGAPNLQSSTHALAQRPLAWRVPKSGIHKNLTFVPYKGAPHNIVIESADRAIGIAPASRHMVAVMQFGTDYYNVDWKSL